MVYEMPVHQDTPVEADRDWWRGAIIDQIYPRSFLDSNGDGLGDLLRAGIHLPPAQAPLAEETGKE